ncbi:hypothetical protein EGT67_13230 [Prescottella agglutinans]|uniref:Uncharacterized protein n=1 Tax=Prescottella agglutinans TaxID=1644129 RepID=A0A3S3AFU3_9NOCA|nr:hypothetical protein [Prescottella agglutinans]RVW09109.1 hypothetical protein EGT67_13230 [Prescottella agglutinans]
MRVVRPAALTVMVLSIGAAAYFSGLLPFLGPGPERAAAEIVDAAVCRTPNELDGRASPPPELLPQSAARPGTVPEDFVPVAAITCDPESEDTMSADLVVATRAHRWEGDFRAAIADLNAPSWGRRLALQSCPTASMVRLPDLWLIDAAGRALRPSYPVDGCGFQRIGGLRAVEALTEVETVEHRFVLSPSGASQLFPCSSVVPTPNPGVAAFDPSQFVPIDSACDYRWEDGGWAFDGARRLHNSVELVAGPPAVGECPAATRAVGSVLDRLGPEFVSPATVLVELDGCRRVLVDGAAPTVASAQTITALE